MRPEAGPWAKSIPWGIQFYKRGFSYLGREVVVIPNCWGGTEKADNLPPCAQTDHTSEPWRSSFWQHPYLHDPLLWDSKTFFLMFNCVVLTWCSWCVPSLELWPWPTNTLILLQVTEAGCLQLKVSCMNWISLSLPKTTSVFCKACSCK